MEVIKMQCTSCGGPLEVKPGLDRAVCPYCGMTYLIGRNGSSAADSRTTSADGDNPVDVLLIPLSANTVVCDSRIKAEPSIDPERFPYTGHASGTIISNYTLNSLGDLDKRIQSGLRFVSRLAYVTGETYTLDIGDLKIDPVYLYYEGERKSTGGSFAPEELADLKEPEALYSGPDMLLKPKGTNYPAFDKKDNDKRNREYDSRIAALVSKYQLEYKDTVLYSPILEKAYIKKSFFGGEQRKKRYWTERYTSRSLYVNVDPSSARQYMTNEDISRLSRMEGISCIPDMASVIFQEFSKDGRRQLEQRTHEQITLEIGADKIEIKNLRNLVTRRQGNRIWQSPQWIDITYHNYGMSEINDPAVIQYLAAHLIKHVNRMLKENGDSAWKLGSFFGDAKLTLHFFPSLQAVGVYNEWV